MIIFRMIHIIAWFVVAFIITEHSAKVAKFKIYNYKVERAYPGVEHHIACIELSDYIRTSVDFLAPNGQEVMTCPKLTSYCKSKNSAYKFDRSLKAGYVLAILSFDPKRDAGIWKCRDKGDSDPNNVASLEVKYSPVYKVAVNNLPDQRNYQRHYNMKIVSTCTHRAPICEWKITGVPGLRTVPPGVKSDVQEEVCGNDFKYTCSLSFSGTPDIFMEKKIIFSITIFHASFPTSAIVPRPSRLLDFPRVRLELEATQLVPKENSTVNLTCSVFQYGKQTGPVKLLRREWGGVGKTFASINQLDQGCGKKVAPKGYGIDCSKGTTDAHSYERVYIFVFYHIRKADFVFWRCSTAERYSRTVRLLPFKVRIEMRTTNKFPVRNNMVHIMCVVLQQGTVTGAVQFFRRQKRTKRGEKMGELIQNSNGCSPSQDEKLPPDYSLMCGLGTEDANTAKKMYMLKIKRVSRDDYAYWFCRQQTARITSSEIRLAPFKVLMELKASNPYPPPGSNVSLTCTITKDGKMLGPVQFFRMTARNRKFSRFAHLLQKADGCVHLVAPKGYELTCGEGTTSVLSPRQVYILHIAAVTKADYTQWYCYQEAEDYISQNISLAPYSVKVDINTTDVYPPLNTTAYLMCTVMQYRGGLSGKVVFFSRKNRKKSVQMGYVQQEDNSCTTVFITNGYDLKCGIGTSSKMTKKKVYKFIIKNVRLRDYTYWYCHHTKARVGSKELLLGPPSVDNPEQFVVLGGGALAGIIISALMAAGVPVGALGFYYKRRKQRMADSPVPTTASSNEFFTQAEDDNLFHSERVGNTLLYEYNDYPEAEPTTQFTESDFWHSFFKS